MRKITKQEESGNMIDLTACLLVFVFTFAMILLYMAYTKSAQMKMTVDNVAKEYIYRLEETGIIDDTMKANLEKSLKAVGCTNVTFPDGWSNAYKRQVPYGDELYFRVEMDLPNPLYEMLGAESGKETIVTFSFIPKTIHYTLERRSVSRW